MGIDLGLTKEQFDQLLAWLDPDPVRAGEKYEKIRHRLITIFLTRHCQEAEDLADETINRVASKAGEFKDSYVGEPARYFYGVAKKVLLEYHRQRSRPILSPPPQASHEELEPSLACLDKCLAKLSTENRELILHYYQEQKKAKIASHQELGKQMQLNAGALRARIFRIRAKLEKCVEECLKNSAEDNDIKLDVI
jgi:RNA polymerase sigma factor (sigma-70 family)